jgi:hypothetical protein
MDRQIDGNQTEKCPTPEALSGMREEIDARRRKTGLPALTAARWEEIAGILADAGRARKTAETVHAINRLLIALSDP